MTTVFLNGRFLRQTVSGVQRFSAEMTNAIDRMIERSEWPATTVLAPRSVRAAHGPAGDPAFRRLRMRRVGRTSGHLWEQTELPGAARDGVLLSLGNTAPLLAGRRQVVVIHDAGVFDTPDSYSVRFRVWYKALQRGLVRAGVQIATVSEFSRARLIARLGVDPDRIAVVLEGADHILRVDPDDGTLARHGLVRGRYALVVGNRVAHKNLAALTEAAALLASRGMVIAVTGASNTAIWNACPTAGFAHRQLGRVSDGELHALYRDAACLLFPSRYEGFGLPPVEAMACGCPVIAARGGAVEEICGGGALYFSAGEPRGITEAISRVLDEEGEAAALRAAGRARAAALSWDASARKLGAVVHRVHQREERG